MSVRIKGQSVIAFERALRQLKGDGAMERIYPQIPSHVRHAVRYGEVLSVGWYPMTWLTSLHGAARLMFGSEISRAIGRTATRHDVTTLYRFILKLVSPDRLIGQYARIFSLFCESGQVVIEEKGQRFAKVRCSGCTGASRGVWDDVLGSTEVILELCGGRCPTARIVSGGEADEVVYMFTWGTV